MKTANSHFFKSVRQNKDDVVHFRIDTIRKKSWVEAMAKLGINDFSSYARQAIDRAIKQDIRSFDPKWQEFITKTQPIAREVLGHEFRDDSLARLENISEIEKMLYERGKQLARERGIKDADELPGIKSKRTNGKVLAVVKRVKSKHIERLKIIRKNKFNNQAKAHHY